MKDRYNLNLLPTEGEEEEMSSSAFSETPAQLPGMGIDDEMMEQMKQGGVSYVSLLLP